MKKTLVTIANSIVKATVNHRQRQVGYTVAFPNVPQGWLTNMTQVDMTYTWNKYGLRGIQGVNYFTMGGVQNNKSTRFDRNSKYYQSWAGCYLFKLAEPKKWDISSLYGLALADQESWLKIYGVNNPKSTVITESIKNLPATQIHGHPTQWQTGYIKSFSDVGARQKHTLNSLKLNVFDYMLRNNNPLDTVLECGIPDYIEEMDSSSFEEVTLSGIIGLTEVSEDIKILFYGNGIIQNEKDTFEEIRQEILDIVTNAQIIKL